MTGWAGNPILANCQRRRWVVDALEKGWDAVAPDNHGNAPSEAFMVQVALHRLMVAQRTKPLGETVRDVVG
jgi:hypothetical protein